MRVFLFLPDTPELKAPLEDCRKKYASVPWIAGDIPVAELVDRLQQDDCKNGYVVESFSNTLEAHKELEELLRARAAKPKQLKLPLHIYWAGKPKKENRDTIKAYREEHKAAGNHLHEHRRLLSFIKPKKLAGAFKDAKKRSKPVQLIRRGVAIAAVAALVLLAIFILFFRDMVIKCTVESQGQEYFQAQVDVASLSTSLSDAGLQINDMAVADQAAPMHNVFEFKQLETSWDIGALSSGKLHATLLRVDGLRFNTARTESGALPHDDGEPVVAEPVEDLAPASEDGDDFMDALNNTMGDFEPPKKEDLASTKAINQQKALAEQRRISLDQKVTAIDVQKSIDQSKQAVENLKKISVLSPDASSVEADLAKNEKALAVLQQEIAVEVAAIKKSLDELKDFKVDTKDLKKAKEMVDQAKDLSDDIKQVEAKVKQAQDLVEQGQASAAKAADDIKAETEKARAELKAGINAVKAPLVETQKQLTDLAAESKLAAKELRAAQQDIQLAVDKDVTAAQKQYSVEGLKAGSEKLMEELIGESIYGQLQTALYYYRVIKPWLPVSDKSAKKTKQKVGKGHVYTFPIAAEDGGLAGMHIHKSEITGDYPSGEEVLVFNALMSDFTNNMAYTQKPVLLKGDGKSASGKTMQLDMRCDLDSILRGTFAMTGLAVDEGQFSAAAASNGIAPQSVTGSSMDVSVSDIALGDGQFDALVAVQIRDLKLGPASGKDVHPEIAAVFNDVYAQLSELSIVLGVGEKKHFETQPNVSKMLSDALNKRVSAKLDSTKQQAEKQIRAYGEEDLKAIEDLAGSFDSFKALEDKQAELAKGNEAIDALTGVESQRVDKDGESAAGSLSAITEKIKQQQQSVAALENSLAGVTKKIDKEKKRIEKEILGGGLKKFIPKF